MFEVNQPDVLAEFSAVFDRYERALQTNDEAVLNELFWDHHCTVRYGVRENLYGHEAIRAFRAAQTTGQARDVLHGVVTTYGNDVATTNIEFRRHGGDKTGRQSQTWLRTDQGWRIVSAHVSLLLS
ncbi:MAG: oxalurate catabolism protein HpxZ [Hydrogenophaga sp.]|nr:oxalurate catabolism protein HpxZ [Hydrogenophaga sp.]